MKTCTANFSKLVLITFVSIVIFSRPNANITADDELQFRLLEVKKIWDRAPHNAFTDLIRWRNRFYCAFREGKAHAGDRGKLRILESPDGKKWNSTGLLELPHHDLRDAAISITPDDRLMVLGGAQTSIAGVRKTGTFVSFSKNGREYSKPRIVIPEGRWLWRVTWNKQSAYGVSYGSPDTRESSFLHKTADGVNYETVTKKHLMAGGYPTEARVRFDFDGTAYSLHRRDGNENTAFLGVSNPPYMDWTWKDLGTRIGGPNFIQLPNGYWAGAGRFYDGGARTEVFFLDPKQGKIKSLLRLPSGGDTSYPGLVWHQDVLWISYYSSHEGKASIYLAKVKIEPHEKPVEITNRLELFVDRYLIKNLDDLTLRIHHPTPAETVLEFNKPWEGAFCGYATVIRDKNKYRMYYRGLPNAGGDGTSQEVTCYAESLDGLKWEKPALGIHEINGTKATNVILQGQTPASHNFSPFLDTNPDVKAAAKFKALGGTSKGLFAFSSPDGIHWKKIQSTPVFTKGIFDSQNVSFYSTAEHKYVCYFRTWTGKGYRGFRTVSRTTSTDFVHWTEPVPMTFGDTPTEHLYTNQTTPYFRAPHLSIGIAARFMPGRQVITEQEAKRIGVNPKYFGDVSDAVLLTTRGGNVYERTFMESFVRPGIGIENWVSRTNYPALGIVPTSKTEMSFYVQKNYGQPSSSLQRYRLRLDGFSSLHADYQPGTMLTRVIRLVNSETSDPISLDLNASTSAAGSIRVQIESPDGKTIRGFSFEDCDLFVGDKIEHTVSWRGKTNLSTLSMQPIRVRIEIKDGDLYSIKFKTN